LNRGIPPKLLRDSRATYLAMKKVGRYQSQPGLKDKVLQAERKVLEMEDRLSGRQKVDGLMTRPMEDKAVQELLVRKVRVTLYLSHMSYSLSC